MQVQIQLQYMKYKLGQSILYIMGGSKTIVQSWWGFWPGGQWCGARDGLNQRKRLSGGHNSQLHVADRNTSQCGKRYSGLDEKCVGNECIW